MYNQINYVVKTQQQFLENRLADMQRFYLSKGDTPLMKEIFAERNYVSMLITCFVDSPVFLKFISSFAYLPVF